jgi:hypothetical protein
MHVATFHLGGRRLRRARRLPPFDELGRRKHGFVTRDRDRSWRVGRRCYPLGQGRRGARSPHPRRKLDGNSAVISLHEARRAVKQAHTGCEANQGRHHEHTPHPPRRGTTRSPGRLGPRLGCDRLQRLAILRHRAGCAVGLKRWWRQGLGVRLNETFSPVLVGLISLVAVGARSKLGAQGEPLPFRVDQGRARPPGDDGRWRLRQQRARPPGDDGGSRFGRRCARRSRRPRAVHSFDGATFDTGLSAHVIFILLALLRNPTGDEDGGRRRGGLRTGRSGATAAASSFHTHPCRRCSSTPASMSRSSRRTPDPDRTYARCNPKHMRPRIARPLHRSSVRSDKSRS